MKIYERLLDMRLRDMVEIVSDQFGFVPKRSTMDVIFIASQVMEKYREKNKPCHIASLDLEKAYDSADGTVDAAVERTDCLRMVEVEGINRNPLRSEVLEGVEWEDLPHCCEAGNDVRW
ncbi:hypothetical protein ANCDUO_00956 [Ancylostoma duodenale]|uniref:Reverse transcriptase domain-containing protein n=1 Tax=Ancylostoma duodenale TaxID=51022 RepID=A0A0C2E054_9BILA|nr:hypothetical protein ANCDUO_00956 [Ancylostoma duodenale]